MTTMTEQIILAVSAKDDSIKKSDLATALAILRGEKPQAEPHSPRRVDRVLSRREASRRRCCSLRTIDSRAARGLLKKVNPSGGRRSLGDTESSVESLLK